MSTVKTARVSVLMPAHNAAGTIAASVDSVLAQTMEAWELIIVDDGSTDATAEIVGRFEDPRIRLLHQEQGGPSAARNRAFADSQAELIAFLDADDLFHPTKLQRQSDFLRDNSSVGSTYCRHRCIDDGGIPWTVRAPKASLSAADFLSGFPFNPSAQMVRRSFHEAAGGFDESLSINEDRDYCLKLATRGCRFALTEDVLADYRVHPAGGRFRRDGLDQSLQVLARHKGVDKRITQASRRAAYQENALQAAAAGDWPFATACMEELRTRSPDLLRNQDRTDDLLQSVVDCAVRSRCQWDPIIRAIFRALEEQQAGWSSEQDWALGSAAVVSGVREVIWGRAEAAKSTFSLGASRGARLDERTQRLLRWDLFQVREAFGNDSWRALRVRLSNALIVIDSEARIQTLLDSVEAQEPSMSTMARLRRWLPTLGPR